MYRAGEIVAERFQLLGEIGSGGMGAVWRARHIVTGENVALKLLHDDSADYQSARERFLREARALATLRSPHIVRVVDSGVDAGTPFIAMELLRGETLAHRLKRGGRLPIAEVLNVVTQAAEGIGAAHEVGIVHRDLKPDNIFLAREEDRSVVKIVDFGIAKARPSEIPLRTLTHSGALVGTPHYMSPEQIDGIPADWRADLWALAVLTFECTVGAKPFNDTTLAKLCLSICEGPVPTPSAFRTVPSGFDAWFSKGVSRNREARFQSARDLADELRTALTGASHSRASGSGVRVTSPPQLILLLTAVDEDLRLIQEFGAEYGTVANRVLQLVSETMQAHGAMLLEESDAFAFHSAATALRAAIALQRAMEQCEWPRHAIVALRIALVDSSEATDGDGVAEQDLLRARALIDAAHGGQILLTDMLADADALRELADVKLEDLGKQELCDGQQQHVFQAAGAGLHPSFAPLRTRGISASNLPRETTSFVGRLAELAAVDSALLTHRLLTLRGPGGVGKSRIARRVASMAAARARDGTFVVPLAAVRDWHLVMTTIASVLSVTEHRERSSSDTLIEYLGSRQLLLVLDNFEHVMPARADVEKMLNSAPDLRIVVTSRTALGVDREHVHDIEPFVLPPADGSTEALTSNDAIQLLLERAQRDHPNFALTAENATALAELVRHLDGLPLAIELAAARLSEVPAAELVRQLRARQAHLHDTTGDVARRHRTLRDVVAWSYDLLERDARTLLRRLAVFIGGFNRELAERTVGDVDVDAGLETLVQSSLIMRQPQAHRLRFAMLETVREFALAELDGSRELGVVRRHHAEAMSALAQNVAPALKREGSVGARDSLALEDGNLRAALDFCLTSGDPQLGLTIAGNLWRYWQAVGRLQEGRRWLVELLACTGATRETRARGLEALAGLAYWQADYAMATRYYREALEIFRDLGDLLAVGETLFALSTTATWSGDSESGTALARQALAIFEEVGAREHVGMVRMAEGFARWMQHDLAGARALWQASIEIAREIGDHMEAAHKTLALASITYAEGDVNGAVRQAIHAMDELFAQHNIALTIMAIDFIASMLVHDQTMLSVRLSGAATQLRRIAGGGMRPEACGLPSVAVIAAERLGERKYRELFEDGRRLDLRRAIELAHVSFREESGVC